MNWLRKLLSTFSRRKRQDEKWNPLFDQKPATTDRDWQQLNGEGP